MFPIPNRALLQVVKTKTGVVMDIHTYIYIAFSDGPIDIVSKSSRIFSSASKPSLVLAVARIISEFEPNLHEPFSHST